MSVRALVKSVVERGAVWSGAAARARRRHRGEVLVFAYHNIVPTGERAAGDRSLHLPQRAFAQQLDLLQETHDIVPLDVAFRPAFPIPSMTSSPATSRPARPRAVITFDDAYRGTVTAGVEEVRARSLPATIFVAPAYVGGEDFWWDVLTPPDAPGLAPAVREHALTACAGRDPLVRSWARETGIRMYDVPTHATCASEAELHDALTHPKLTLGSHTWSHPNLTTLDAPSLAAELHEPARWLSARFHHRVVSAVTYPYGCTNATVMDAARAAGYDTGFLITGGWTMPEPSDRQAIPRLNVPAGVSQYGFAMRASGLIPGSP